MKATKRLGLMGAFVAMLALPAVVQAQDYSYTDNGNGTCTITLYTGPGGALTVTNTINGLTVTSIANSTFYNCSNLTSVTIPSSVSDIEDGTFRLCRSLTTVTVDKANSTYSSIDGILFNKIQTWLMDCPGGKAGSVSITNTVTIILGDSMRYCTNLTSVTIPSSVTVVEDGAFSLCFSMTAITVHSNNSTYSSADGVLFNKSQTTLIKCPAGKAGSYTIPDSVTNVVELAFEACGCLTDVTIGCNVMSFGWQGPFLSCGNLTAITVNTNNPAYSSADGVLFNKVQTVLIQCPAAKTGDFTVPSTVTSIGNWALYCGLTGIYFKSNAPSTGVFPIGGDVNLTVYYLPGTTGWSTFDLGDPSRPTLVLWNPHTQADADFGVRTNVFGFTIAGSSNLVIVTEACTNLVDRVWSTLGTNTLTGGSSYFGDLGWTNHPVRFYRFRSP